MRVGVGVVSIVKYWGSTLAGLIGAALYAMHKKTIQLQWPAGPVAK